MLREPMLSIPESRAGPPQEESLYREAASAAQVHIVTEVWGCVANSAKMRMHPSLYPIFGLVQMIIEPQLLIKTLGTQLNTSLLHPFMNVE